MDCWVITEGIVGTENQCLGVAQALQARPKVLKIGLNQPWKSFSPWLGLEAKNTFVPPLTEPWPDLLITSGRKAVAASRYIKKQSNGKTITLHIQDPKISPKAFDILAVPHHDNCRGENVIVTDAAPNKITAASLKQEKEKFSILFKDLPEPRIAVLIGGNSKTHKIDRPILERLVTQLKSIDASLMITASRRTGQENIQFLKENLNGKNVYFYDGTGENPYLGMLAWADHILVTNDSVSMISDAGTTGKPVSIIELDGSSAKFDRFYEHLTKLGVIHPFQGNFEPWSYEPLNDAQKIAQAVQERFL